MMENEYFVIFGGGGVRGVSYVGALRSLLENNIKITGYAGSSIGAVFATLCALGFSLNEIQEAFYGINVEFFKDINFDFKNQIALSKGEYFLEWMRSKIEERFYGESYKKGEMPPVRFRDLKSELVIYSCDLTNSKYNEFSPYNTPDAEVALAVRASVSMPGLFKPLDINGNYIVDGDLMKSWPLWRLSETLSKKPERILEFRLEDNGVKREINNAIDYINAVYNTLTGFASDYIIDVYGKKDKFDYIKINTDNISVVDFMAPIEKKEEMANIGYETTKKYFETVLPQKKEKLYKIYSKIENKIFKFKDELRGDKIAAARLELAELFVILCEDKRFIDLVLYERIFALYKLFNEKISKKKNFFLQDVLKIENKDELKPILGDIIKFLAQKIKEVKVQK